MWNENKLNEYIANQVEEDINLDYKAAGSLQNTDGKKTKSQKMCRHSQIPMVE